MMRILLRVAILICGMSAALLGLALLIGHRLPPSGTILAFTAHCPDDTEIYLYDWSNGSRIRVLKSLRRLESMPNLRPDNWQIAYEMPQIGKLNDVHIGDLTGEIPQNLIYLPLSNEERVPPSPPPVWSHDGRQLALVELRGQTRTQISQISVVGTATHTLREFSLSAAASSSPVWSPDGKYIATVSNSYGSVIFIIDIDAGEIRTLSSPGLTTDLVWSPDGKYLAFTSFFAPRFDSKIRMVDVETEKTMDLTDNPAINYTGAAWSPDGQHIATIADGHQVQILDVEGAVIRIFGLQQLQGYAHSVSWSPDGNYLAIREVTHSQSSNYLISTASGSILDLSLPSCSSDGVVWAVQ
jgi:Tol biopolymer transport system component